MRLTLAAAIVASMSVVLLSPGIAAPVTPKVTAALDLPCHGSVPPNCRHQPPRDAFCRQPVVELVRLQPGHSRHGHPHELDQRAMDRTDGHAAHRGEAEDSATWIGVGGGCLNSGCSATDSTLVQAGTEQDVSSTGQASYDAWYEIIPVPEIASTIAVHAGDVIDCSISQVVPGLWTITLNDATDGQGFTQTVPYPSDGSTAEWIEETPTEIGTSGTSLAALPN